MTDERDPGPQLGGRLTTLLKRSFLELERLHEGRLAAHGIDVRELALLMFLAGREPASQQEAARRLGIDRTTMVAMLDSLEGKGLVVRRPDAGDRRRNVVVVTDAGRKTLAKATRASDKAEQELLAELDDGEAALLRSLLQRISTRAR